jgi:VWFA-related protein
MTFQTETTVVAIILVSLPLPGVHGAPRAQTPQPTFRTTVELVVVHVNVADAQKRPVANLSPQDFVVLEDGRPQHLSHFLSADGPLDVALLLDASSSMAAILPTLRSSAREFVEGLAPDDRVMLVGFDRRIRLLAELTTDRTELRQAVGALRTTGSTSLFDGLYITLKTLSSAANDLARRRAIVVLSDGHDTSSNIDAESVIRQSQRSAIPIYTLLFDDEIAPSLQTYDAHRRLVQVKALAKDSGGRNFEIDNERLLGAAYDAIAQDLSQQYLLAYVSSAAPNRGHTPHVVVRIPSQPGAIARTHVGYLDGPL